MSKPRVIDCQRRVPDRKKTSMEPDGYVYTLEYPQAGNLTRMIFLLGFRSGVFKPKPFLHFISPSFLTKLEENARKHGDKLFNLEEAVYSMKTNLSGNALTNEEVTPDVLEALRDFETQHCESKPSSQGGGQDCSRPDAKADCSAASNFPRVALS